MIYSEIKRNVSSLSGVVDEDKLTTAIRMAAVEVWNTIDIPGTMQEIRVRTDSERYVTLPWMIYKVRSIRNAIDRMQLELNTPHMAYHDYEWYQGPYQCVLIRKLPTQERIINASTLKFKLRAAETSDLTISVVGEVDNASRVVEQISVEAGTREVISTQRFIRNLEAITKNRVTNTDIDIYDADDRWLGTFPNHLPESTYFLAQVRDRASYQAVPYFDVFDILFKPHLPPLEQDTDIFPSPFDQGVIFKSLEQLKLSSDKETDIATAYANKGASAPTQFSEDEARGKTMRPNIRYARNVTVYSGKI